jgi:hypothetical protein
MNWNGVAGEGVHGEDVEVLRRFALHAETRIAHSDIELGLAVGKEVELGVGNVQYQRVNFVVTDVVAQTAVSCNGTRAESDDADADGALLLFLPDSNADAGVRPVVSGGPVTAGRVEKLLAVIDGAVGKSSSGGERGVKAIVTDF